MAPAFWNVWLFAGSVFAACHLGLAWAPACTLLAAFCGLSLGWAVAPSATAVGCWLLLFVVVLPEIVLMHLGYYGARGWLLLAPYWLWTWATGRWDPDLRTAELSRARGSAFWRRLAAYFAAARLHVDGELGEGLKLFVAHPHGLWSAAVWANLIPDTHGEALPRRRVCTLDMNFKIPLLRDLLFAMGLIGSSSSSIRRSLAKGVDVVLVVGGGKEALSSEPGTMDLVLRTRRGFVKLALESGASLVPVLNFGENAAYSRAGGASAWDPVNRLLLRTFGMSLPTLQGWKGTFLPHPTTELHSVVGPPLRVPRVEKPSQEQIEEVHAKYCAALQELYDKYKDKFDKDRKRDMRMI